MSSCTPTGQAAVDSEMKRENPEHPEAGLSGLASEQAYNTIVDLILCRDLRPGERTSVNLLATRLRLGRTPIKEAITRLQAEGVLSVAGRSGTTVKTIGAAEAAQLFALRRTLEEFAADFAVRNVTKRQLARLRELLKVMAATSVGKAAEDASAAARFVRANVAFHATLLGAAGNPFLDRLYGQLQLQAQIMSYLLHRGFDPAAAKKRQREHEGIVAALVAGNAGLLKQNLRNHAAGTEAVILRALEGSPSLERARPGSRTNPAGAACSAMRSGHKRPDARRTS
jgi:DNA-binding GntR family transcriptional regulator